jgi:aspartyl-tRNA(Asn)/glutamyl-tRNA(Gln) amidotransferase subunit A
MNRRQLLAALLAGPLPMALRPIVNQNDDFTTLSILEASRRIADRTLSPLDLLEAYLTRISRHDPELHAFITVTAERAAREARRESRGALRGIVVAHKDLFETAGVRTTAGSRLYESYVPARDADAVARLADAGAVMIGKTNTHELGGGVTTINPFFGTTRNPVDARRIPGGSSGGSAAAVGARLCAAATGSDTGGSVRIPAAFCGIVGFIPTFGRVSTAGLLGACPTFDRVGFMARSVEDVTRVYFAAIGRTDVAAAGSSRPRLGIARRYFFDRLEPDVDTAMADLIDRMRRAGVEIVDRDLPVDESTMERVLDPVVASEIWTRYGQDWRTRPELFSPDFAEFFKTSPPPPGLVAAARQALAEFQRQVDEVVAGVDAVLTPTVPVTAPLIDGPIDEARILRNTWPFNAARTPTISVPYNPPRALPIGIQLTARRGRDDRLLEMARVVEG